MTKTDGINNLFDVMEQSGFKVSEFNEVDNTFVATTLAPDKVFKGMLKFNNEETYMRVLLEESDEVNHSFWFASDSIEGDENSNVSIRLLKIKYSTKFQRRLEEEKEEALNILSKLENKLISQSVNLVIYLETIKEELEVMHNLQIDYESIGGDLDFYESRKQDYIVIAKNFIEDL